MSLALRVNNAGIFVAVQRKSLAAVPECFLDAGQQNHPPSGRRHRGHEQSVIFAGVQTGERATGVTANTIGSQPFAIEQSVKFPFLNAQP